MKSQSVESKFANTLKEILGNKIKEMSDFRGDLSIIVDKEEILDICKTLKEHRDVSFEQMMDLTAVDYYHYEDLDYRFQVVYHFFSLTTSHRLRIKCNLDEDDVTIPSITSLWEAADWYERECYDMYGIHFDGHSDLRRILMYDGFEGYPLRKDYDIAHEQPCVELREVTERHTYMEEFKL